MLVAYPSSTWNSGKSSPATSKKRTVLYFHWLAENDNGKKARHQPVIPLRRGRWGNSAQDDGGNANEAVMGDLLRTKEEWVRLIHECFFPHRAASTAAAIFPGKLGGNSLGLNGYLGQKLLVILNPVAGSGAALKVFKERVIPVLRDAGTDYEVLVSERRRHAYDVMRGENLARWRGVVAVSGDGTVAEVFRGLFDRADWQDALAHLAVSAVPVGGRNAFAR